MAVDQKLSGHEAADDPMQDLCVGRSAVIQNVIALIHQVSLYPTTTVLLQGESGTGKDVVARAIHQLSGCSPARFAPLNCAAIPEALLETELFGVEAGAFTDARVSRDGYLARAHRGTLFLDEVGSMPLPLQAKILRVLETRRFCRVGSTKEHKTELRVISATNTDLRIAVEHKEFRDDLFYRLKVMTIDLPPLRERREDIPFLVEHFLRRMNERRSIPLHMSSEAFTFLEQYTWPGNVRELLNVFEHCQVVCVGNIIRPEDLPEEVVRGEFFSQQSLLELRQQLHLPSEGVHLFSFLNSIETSFIYEALARCNGNQVHAASLLGISRDQLRYRLRRLDRNLL